MRYVYFSIVMLLANPLLAQDEPAVDPISDKLIEAKATYRSEVAEAKQSLLKEIDARVERVENSPTLSVEAQLSLLKELAAQRKAFASDPSALPEEKKLLSKVSRFKRQLRESRKSMENAFDKAADAYRKPPAKNFEAAASVLEERKTFFETFFEIKLKPGNVDFEPAFNDTNWTASSPKLVKVKSNQLRIAATPGGNVVLTQRSDFEPADVVIEFSAEKDTEAFIILNAKLENGKWTGATSKIHFENGKIFAGGLRPGYRPRAEQQKEFGVGEFVKLRLHLRQHPAAPEKLLCHSWTNGKSIANLAYPWEKYDIARTGAIGFIVNKGAISVKMFAATENPK